MEKEQMYGKTGRIIRNNDGKEWDYLIGKQGKIMRPVHIFGFQDVSRLVSIQLSPDDDILNRVNVPVDDIEVIN
jgi:hypothetical protein